MQVITLLIVAMVYLSEEAAKWSPWDLRLTSNQRVMLSLLGPAIAIGACWIVFYFCRRRIESRGSWSAVLLADRALLASTWLALGIHIFNIVVLGLLGGVRSSLGNWIVIDEALAMMPPVLIILGAWWCYYPINRRLREAAFIRHLDAGRPIYPIWTRREYVLSQARLHFGLVLLPALFIMGWAEAIEMFWKREDGEAATWLRGAALAAGVGAIFLFAPVLMTRIWDTTPLAPGDLRRRLERLCSAHGVRVRKLLVWNTHGGMINGAVMGLVGRLRYILLTDALLDTMTTTQVEAVMAHEVGHARRHHLPWLAVCLVAILASAGLVSALALRAAEPYIADAATDSDLFPSLEARIDVPRGESLSGVRSQSRGPREWMEPISLVATVIMALGAFGWTSRRFERQADTFAVQHLSGLTRQSGGEAPITPEAANAMSEALLLVAELNHIPLRRRSWRHGSIQWRREYLQSLIGRRCDALPIDRQMRLIQLGAAVVLFASLAITWGINGFG